MHSSISVVKYTFSASTCFRLVKQIKKFFKIKHFGWVFFIIISMTIVIHNRLSYLTGALISFMCRRSNGLSFSWSTNSWDGCWLKFSWQLCGGIFLFWLTSACFSESEFYRCFSIFASHYNHQFAYAASSLNWWIWYSAVHELNIRGPSLKSTFLIKIGFS